MAGKKKSGGNRNRKPAQEAEAGAFADLSELEKELNRVREDVGRLIERRGRRRMTESLSPDAVAAMEQRFSDGEMLTRIRVWLKREYGVDVSYTTLKAWRARWLGRKFPKAALREIEKIEGMVDPLRRVAEIQARLDARYRAHVELEQQLGVPMDKPASGYLKLMAETTGLMLDVMERLGLAEPAKVEVKHSVSEEAFQTMKLEKLARIAESLKADLAKEQDGGTKRNGNGAQADT